jgi:hypothetical protein
MNTILIFLLVCSYVGIGFLVFRRQPKQLKTTNNGILVVDVNLQKDTSTDSITLTLPKKETSDDLMFRLHLEEHWSKCSFCGASNGKFNRQLEQHRARCRYVGFANSFELSRPNYYKFLEEDDINFLQAAQDRSNLLLAKKEITKLKTKTETPN